MSSYDVNGRTVLITGAARGIGAEAAVRLHGKGANVALVGLEPERLEALAARLGDRAVALEADVTDAGALERAVADTVARFGGLDVAIANAGIHNIGALASAPMDQIERVIEVNLMGVLRTDRAVLPQIMERKGYLLNISSLSAVAHAPLMGPYTAAKAGVEAMTDALRAEVRPSGARVGCAYFGFIDTDLVRASNAHPSTQLMMQMMPGFLRKAVPVSQAVDAIERGVDGRKARVWAPRFVGGALLLRGPLQPLSELRLHGSKRLAGALELVDPARGGDTGGDSELGVAGALPDRERIEV